MEHARRPAPTDSLLLANAYLFLGEDGEAVTNFGARGQCGQGLIPAHGLIFVPPTACDCGDYTRGYQALTSKVPGQVVPENRRLKTHREAAGNRLTGWTHFLGGITRTSNCSAELPGELKVVWTAELGSEPDDLVAKDRRQSERWLGALTAPTATKDVVVVSLPERHEVAALNAKDGTLLWRVPTIGKVDSPPTLSHGLAIYGTASGYVTARNLNSGKLVWQFRAAPTDGVVMNHGHFASPHPLPGSVLVLGDRVIAVAGHHTDLGGLHIYSLQATTGKVLASRVIDASLPGVISNGILVGDADGRGFWLGSHKSQMHLPTDLQDLPEEDGEASVISFDRSGTRIRFRTADGRGGSTHGWKQAMQTRIGGLRAHRVAIEDGTAYGLQDPTSRMRHPVNAGKTPTLVAMSGTWREKQQQWSLSQLDLGNPESLSALIKVDDRLYVGGGRRDGSSGFVAVVSAKTGKVEGSLRTPSRVTECGLAAVDGRLLVCCENGSVICFAGE